MLIGDPPTQQTRDAEFWLGQARAPRQQRLRTRTAALVRPVVLAIGTTLLLLWMLLLALQA